MLGKSRALGPPHTAASTYVHQPKSRDVGVRARMRRMRTYIRVRARHPARPVCGNRLCGQVGVCGYI